MFITKGKKTFKVYKNGEPGDREAMINSIAPRYFGNRIWIKVEFKIINDPTLKEFIDYNFLLDSKETHELLKAVYVDQGIPSIVDINEMIGKFVRLYFGYTYMSTQLTIISIKPRKKYKN